MDASGKGLYFSRMTAPAPIPVFALFGETAAFPDVVHCERFRDRARRHDWVITPHRHDQMAQVFYMERGTAKVRLDGETGCMEDGGFLYVPPQVVHGFAFARGTEGLVLSFPMPVLGAAQPDDAELRARLGRVMRGRATPELARLFVQFAGRYADTGTFRTQALVALSHLLLATLCEVASDDGRAAASGNRRRMQEFDALLARHLAEGWRPRDYASALGITPGHLARICREVTGENPTRHIEAAVMREACRLLAFTQMPVAEVGYALGFGDPAYFSRRFRAAMGENPSNYRARFFAQGAV